MKILRKNVQGSADEVTDAIVKEMWRLSNRDSKDPIIIKRAKSLKGKNKTETIKNIYNYVVKKVPYVSDPPEYEQITAPIHLENGTKKGGDCDCQVTLLSSLLSAVGIESRIRTIAWRMVQFTHVVLEANNGWVWKVLDPTRGANGYGKTIDSSLIKRNKIYGNPMDIVTLEDCGCIGDIKSLADCGCGGKCGGCGKGKNRAKNYNNNIINIGNEFAESLNLRYNNSSNQNSAPNKNVTHYVDNETGEDRKLITLKTKPVGTRKRITRWTVKDGAFY